MGKVTSHISGGTKFCAFIDDMVSSVTGHRLFTDVVTDRSLKEKIEIERRKRGYKGVVTKSTRADAIEALRALKERLKKSLSQSGNNPSEMSLVIEPIRSRTCLSAFRCGVKEIETFSKKAFKQHSKAYPKYRVRVLYVDDVDVGFYSISVTQPNDNGRILDTKQLYAGASAFLYVDHLAVRAQEQGKKYSNALMVDLIELAFKTMQNIGRIFAIGLNAADSDAISFFEKWGFVVTSQSTNPFMFMDRASLNDLYNEIFNSDT